METGDFTITPPKGYEIDEENSTRKHIVFKEIEEVNFPQSWKNLKEIKGWWIDIHCNIRDTHCLTTTNNKCVVPTKGQAEAILALEQLLMLRHIYNGGKEPHWNNVDPVWCVVTRENKICVDNFWGSHRVLSFINKKTAQAFFDAPEIHRLLEIAECII